jgi:hypothetical protein
LAAFGQGVDRRTDGGTEGFGVDHAAFAFGFTGIPLAAR